MTSARPSPFGLGWPNVLSVSRVLLVPVIVVLLLVRTRVALDAAAAVFAAGALTDFLDGYLARRFQTASRTGQWLDPLADKLLVTAPIVVLTAQGRFPLWAAVLILAREALVVGLRIYLGTRGRGMPASGTAKLKTLAQLAAIALSILPLGAGWSNVTLAVVIVAVVLTVYTGAEYAIRASGWRRATGAGPARPAPAEERHG
jgi:CDP-diacylglycerol--glycerol-3-phosphate 3-phosphatidyltransferase